MDTWCSRTQQVLCLFISKCHSLTVYSKTQDTTFLCKQVLANRIFILHPTSIIRQGGDSNPSLFHRPSLLVATPPPEPPLGTTRGACKDGGSEALARLSWSGRCGGGADLARDGGRSAAVERIWTGNQCQRRAAVAVARSVTR
jgi:hypothetical protein